MYIFIKESIKKQLYFLKIYYNIILKNEKREKMNKIYKPKEVFKILNVIKKVQD